MDSTWQILHFMASKGGYRNQYSEPSLGLEEKNPMTLKLDEMPDGLVGELFSKEVRQFAVNLDLPFGVQVIDIILEDKVAKALTWNQEDSWIQPEKDKRATAQGWSPHVVTMGNWKIVRRINVGNAKVVCTYFAVPKNEEVARTVFNGRYTSQQSKTPPPVNILDIQELLQMVGMMDNVHYHFMDIRHWFHQVPVCQFLQERFCIYMKVRRQVGEYYCWQVVPMGWSWSPYICQCIAWVMILNTTKEDRKHFYYNYPKGLKTPPRYVDIHRSSDKERVGFVTLLYDNVGVFVNDNRIGLKIREQILASCKKCHIILKREPKDSVVQGSPMDMNIELLNDAMMRKKRNRGAHFNNALVYRGVQFGAQYLLGSFRPVWRCDPEKVEKWKKAGFPLVAVCYLLTKIASWVGVVIWSMTVRCEPLCDAAEVIEILRRVAVLAQGTKWKQETTLSEKEVEVLTQSLKITHKNEWQGPPPKEEVGNPTVIATDACPEGWGWTVMDHECSGIPRQGSGLFHASLISLEIIFLKELAVMVITLIQFIRKGEKGPFLMVGDNTAACAALRRRYSTNIIACMWLRKLTRVERKFKVPRCRVLVVKSEDMSADGLSRDPTLILKRQDSRYVRCQIAIRELLAGRVPEPGTRAPATGKLRHMEPDSNIDIEQEKAEQLWTEMQDTSASAWQSDVFNKWWNGSAEAPSE